MDREQTRSHATKPFELTGESPEGSTAAGGAFDSLIRQAARVSDVSQSGMIARSSLLPIGSTLAAGRLQVLRRIGEGGMGVVYEAFDTERRERLALKTLLRLDASGIYGIKNEFRSLADLQHPNLVRLHELFAVGEQWFFTMDLVHGERFDLWARRPGRLDEARLRGALAQLVDAVTAIHAAGKLHRDLKPSNVLVTAAGRVVVLDFGLAADARHGGVGQTLPCETILGTPAYMSPEQAAGDPATEMSDFYALGVMLFEALSGRLPFEGKAGEMLAAKQRDLAPALSEFACALPSDLESLCMELLRRDGALRPSRVALLARTRPNVDTKAALAAAESSPPVPPLGQSLLGRDVELASLRAAYQATLEGQPVVIFVAGESGMGKSALCHEFVRELHAEQRAVVLAGRCYERESVPFKAFDLLVDELSRYLRRLPAVDAGVLLPRDACALARLFPVLARVAVIAEAPARDEPPPLELERRAFAAFHELLARIRDRQPLVLLVDDLQWIDPGSVAFLSELLSSGVPIPLLLLLSHRSERATSHRWLERVLHAATSNPRLDVRHLGVGPLPFRATAALARRLLHEPSALAPVLSGAIARESRGSPFFVVALAQFARAENRSALGSVSLASVVAARLDALPAPACRLLQVLALSSQPLPVDIAFAAASASHADLDLLRDTHLVRGSAYQDEKLIECYHDRIREHVCALLSKEQSQTLHAGLANALGARESADPELLCRSLEGAGKPAAAAREAARAAREAMAAMAFDRAANWYRRALAFGAPSTERCELAVSFAQALAAAGRCAEAATAFRAAAPRFEGERKQELSLRAAEQLFATGQPNEGMALLGRVCAELGVSFPIGGSGGLVELVLGTARLRLRGLRFRSRTHCASRAGAAASAGRADLPLLTASIMSSGLMRYRPLEGATAACRYVLQALDSNDPLHVVRALGLSIAQSSLLHPKSAWVDALLAQLEQVANRDRSPLALASLALSRGVAFHTRGEFREARAHIADALAMLSNCAGVSWELDVGQLFDELNAFACGDYAVLRRAAPARVAEALRRGRFWSSIMLSAVRGTAVHLSSNDTQAYRVQLHEARRQWTPQAEPQLPDLVLDIAEATLSLYGGAAQVGFERLEARRNAYSRALLIRGSGVYNANYVTSRGRCAAATLGAPHSKRPSHERRALCQAVRGSALQLRRNGNIYTRGAAEALDAALELARGHQEQARDHLQTSLPLLDAANMRMEAAAVRYRLGQLLGGDAGRQLVTVAHAAMRAEGIRDLEAMTELLCPGCRSV